MRNPLQSIFGNCSISDAGRRGLEPIHAIARHALGNEHVRNTVDIAFKDIRFCPFVLRARDSHRSFSGTLISRPPRAPRPQRRALPASRQGRQRQLAPTSNSLAFWLTAERRRLAENGHYFGKAVLSRLAQCPAACPESPRAAHFSFASHSLWRDVRAWLTQPVLLFAATESNTES